MSDVLEQLPHNEVTLPASSKYTHVVYDGSSTRRTAPDDCPEPGSHVIYGNLGWGTPSAGTFYATGLLCDHDARPAQRSLW